VVPDKFQKSSKTIVCVCMREMYDLLPVSRLDALMTTTVGDDVLFLVPLDIASPMILLFKHSLVPRAASQ